MVQVDEYDTLKDAVMAAKGSSETADLNAYVSDAKAVLMSDAKTTVNTGIARHRNHQMHRIHVMNM